MGTFQQGRVRRIQGENGYIHPGGEGDDFRLLGCMFDVHLQMETAIRTILGKVRPKIKALLRARIYHSQQDMVMQYKAHILPLLEHHSAAIFHATDTILKPFDKVQSSFLQEIGLTEKEALLSYNLAPTNLRRDIAILGLLHKCNLKKINYLFRCVLFFFFHIQFV